MYCIWCENLRRVDGALKGPFQGWLSAIDPVKEMDIAVDMAWLDRVESAGEKPALFPTAQKKKEE